MWYDFAADRSRIYNPHLLATNDVHDTIDYDDSNDAAAAVVDDDDDDDDDDNNKSSK